MTHRTRQRHLPKALRESGSAYIVTLLALVILTIVGLSLSLVSQTERELGVNEVNTQRIFYAANSGIGASTARALGVNNYNRLTYIANKKSITGSVEAADRVKISCFFEISASPANATELDIGLWNVHYALTARGERVSWEPSDPDDLPTDGPGTKVRSTQVVAQMATVQPWETGLGNCQGPLDEIKF